MNEKWLTLNEAGELTGKSAAAVRMWIRRRTSKDERVRVKKERGKRGETWFIHSSEVNALSERELPNVQGEQTSEREGERVNIISLDRYEAMRKELEREREQAVQGMMMYRYKFEELDAKLRLLPAPVEIVNHELKKKEDTLAQAQEIIKEAQQKQEQFKITVEQLEQKLKEEEMAKEAFRIEYERAQAELKRPWWKKLFQIRSEFSSNTIC